MVLFVTLSHVPLICNLGVIHPHWANPSSISHQTTLQSSHHRASSQPSFVPSSAQLKYSKRRAPHLASKSQPLRYGIVTCLSMEVLWWPPQNNQEWHSHCEVKDHLVWADSTLLLPALLPAGLTLPECWTSWWIPAPPPLPGHLQGGALSCVAGSGGSSLSSEPTWSSTLTSKNSPIHSL